MSTNKYGYTDRPEAVDQLGVGRYYEALADYIENCEAPTTISIQLHNKDLYFNMVQHTGSGEEMRAFLRGYEADEAYIELIDEALELGLFDEEGDLSESGKKKCKANLDEFCRNLVIASSITSSESADDAGAAVAELKIGEYVRQQLGQLIHFKKLSRDMVNNMQMKGWCESTLHLDYPFLKPRKPNKQRKLQITVNGRTVYWAKTVTIYGTEYYVCNQWYEPMRPYFDMWLETVRGE